MAMVNICDICGKPILDRERKKEYKIKKNENIWNVLFGIKMDWVDISAHESCIELLLAARDNQITNEMTMEEIRKKIITEVGNDK